MKHLDSSVSAKIETNPTIIIMIYKEFMCQIGLILAETLDLRLNVQKHATVSHLDVRFSTLKEKITHSQNCKTLPLFTKAEVS